MSTIRIKNGLVVGPLTVTPVLYMADGTEYGLAPVNLTAGGIASIDVNAALESAPPVVANHLSQYGSAALRYRWIAPGTVVRSIQVMNDAQSLVFDYPFMPVQPGAVVPQTTNGVWWKHGPGMQSFVAVSNTTSPANTATLHGTTAEGIPLPSRTVDLPPHAMQLVNLDSAFGKELGVGTCIANEGKLAQADPDPESRSFGIGFRDVPFRDASACVDARTG